MLISAKLVDLIDLNQMPIHNQLHNYYIKPIYN